MTLTQDDKQTYDLTEEPWIRVIRSDGRPDAVSLRAVFREARDIQRIAGESPQQDAALLRLLLVVLWRAHAADPRMQGFASEELAQWWADALSGAGDEEVRAAVDAYLDATRQRWDLLDPERPFMQVAGLSTAKGEHGSVRKLVQDSESDYFSMRAADALESLDVGEAARWLVHLQAWNYSGIKSGAVGDPRVKGGKGYPIGTGWTGRTGLVVIHGDCLAQTLILNTAPDAVFGESLERDLPVWEREPDGPAPRGVEHAAGPCDLLTWQARRVRLVPAGGRIVGAVVANGDRIQSHNELNDPMTAYRFSEPQTKKLGREVWMPRPHAAERTLWRGVEPLLTRETDSRSGLRAPATVAGLRTLEETVAELEVLTTVELVGTVYGTQDAMVTTTLHEDMPVRLSVLTDGDVRTAHIVITAAEAGMAAGIATGQFAGMLQQAAGGEYAFDVDAAERTLDGLNEPFKEWLARFDPRAGDVTAQREHWFDAAEAVVLDRVRTLIAGAAPGALLGREDDDGRLVSAATAYSLLRRRLDAAFGRGSAGRAAAAAAAEAAASSNPTEDDTDQREDR